MHKIIYTGQNAPSDKKTYLWKKKDENGNVALYEYKGTRWEKVADVAEDTPRLPKIEVRDLFELSTEEKTKIIELHDSGLLFDAIISVGGDALYRVITDEIELNDTITVVIADQVNLVDVSI